VVPVKMDGKWQVHSGAGGDYYEKLTRDKVTVRSLKEGDLAAIVRIDGKHTGLDARPISAPSSGRMLVESGIRVSLVAEDDGIATGFIMARVDFGEFGKVEKTAHDRHHRRPPRLRRLRHRTRPPLQLLLNLSTLKVETVLVQVSQEISTCSGSCTRAGSASPAAGVDQDPPVDAERRKASRNRRKILLDTLIGIVVPIYVYSRKQEDRCHRRRGDRQDRAFQTDRPQPDRQGGREPLRRHGRYEKRPARRRDGSAAEGLYNAWIVLTTRSSTTPTRRTW